VSDLVIQPQRKAESIRDASELVQAVKPDAERLSLAMQELLIGNEDKIAALVYELAEMCCRLDRALDHISDHVVSSQEQEIRALKKRVAALEPSEASSKAAAKEK
jgi:hypothetical protein